LFSDSDVYKTLEAVGWELDAPGELRVAFSAMTDVVAKAQDADGYVHSWFGLDGREPWSDLTNGHEMYCAGHLIQAGVAAARCGDGRLLEIAQRFAGGEEPARGVDRDLAGVGVPVRPGGGVDEMLPDLCRGRGDHDVVVCEEVGVLGHDSFWPVDVRRAALDVRNDDRHECVLHPIRFSLIAGEIWVQAR
jgi:DUF1680 family protein